MPAELVERVRLRGLNGSAPMQAVIAGELDRARRCRWRGGDHVGVLGICGMILSTLAAFSKV